LSAHSDCMHSKVLHQQKSNNEAILPLIHYPLLVLAANVNIVK
jgi:hypothetical protein